MIELSNADYHARTDHVSKSMLDLLAKSPAHLRAWLDGERGAATPDMLLGTAAHTAVLEPEKLLATPVFNRRSKEGKAEAEAFEAEYAGQDVTLVDPDTFAKVLAIRDGVFRHPVAARILDEGLPERSVLTELEGVQVRCRPDWFRPSAGLIIDLKTTVDAAPDAFSRSAWTYRYHVQHAFYCDVCRAAGIDVRAFVFIAVEKKPPYCAAVYVLDDAAIELGRRTYRHGLALYRRCLESGLWPGYSEKLEILHLPAWAKDSTPPPTEDY